MEEIEEKIKTKETEKKYNISTSFINECEIQSIEDVLDYLSKTIENIEEGIIRLAVFYLKNRRHKYSKVSSYINNKGIDDEQVISYLLYNIQRVENYCENNQVRIAELIDEIKRKVNFDNEDSVKFDNKKLVENLEKLNDHIVLEEQRIMFYQNKEKKTQTTFISQINNSTKYEREKMEERTKQLKEEMNNSTISILGIFSAIVMVFFGGLNVLGTILSAINKASYLKISFMASLTGIIVFNIIFLLLYVISKLVDKSIAVNDLRRMRERIYKYNENDNILVKDKRMSKKYIKILDSPSRRLKLRYPIVFWYNFFMILIMIGCVTIWCISKYLSIKGI